jgi:hypothetical protein
VWVGLIALMGLDAETGVFMLLFLDLAIDERAAEGRLRTRGDLHEAIIHGAVKRVRPKAMTVFAAMLGLLPIMWSIGTGADLMKRVAAPMVGGLVDQLRPRAPGLSADLLPVARRGDCPRGRRPRRPPRRRSTTPSDPDTRGPHASGPSHRPRPHPGRRLHGRHGHDDP